MPTISAAGFTTPEQGNGQVDVHTHYTESMSITRGALISWQASQRALSGKIAHAAKQY